MKGKQKTYSIFQQVSAIFMVLALLWLTVSTPFVFASQQRLAEHKKANTTESATPGTNDDASNPFSNTTEEKNPSSTSLSEEFLHDHYTADHFFSIASQYHKCENADTYNAFHGELLVPPPNLV
ncbi:MAG: hypothetical protein IPP02_16655 [Chitinophagaceae bacterium]|jgi:hypothetical protein|nr:hypothetical protein [Chitinophagaceae bacterium]MBK7680165.1 hypothetical protein [Chitinophagaceae bacterium]MBK8301126.1 hypothetical protein [Chitinophagaceae bacterium]MBK9465450.1 hypothetical protein [Chitinophagaceae bacterium]MBK9660802.1 hypothetical protein [Chitinophagaceae bacterium]